ASACSSASINPPGMPQPLPPRNRCFKSSTRPLEFMMMPAADAVKRVLERRTPHTRTNLGVDRQIDLATSLNIAAQLIMHLIASRLTYSRVGAAACPVHRSPILTLEIV